MVRREEGPPSVSSYPMLKFAEDLGHIKRGVHNLEDGQQELDEKVSGLYRTVGNLVTKEDCQAHRAETEVIVPEAAATAPPPLLDRMAKGAKSVTAILVLAGLLGGLLLAGSRFVSSVERALARDRAAQESARESLIQELKRAQEPVIVHQPVYIYPDAGTRRRRRRRRPVRPAN